MGKAIHFDIPATDPEKSGKFYGKVFGWKLNKIDGMDYWLTEGGPSGEGINGGLMKRRDPGQPLTINIEVKDIDKAAEMIVANGGEIVVPKMPVPGGSLLFFKDPDGNILGAAERQ